MGQSVLNVDLIGQIEIQNTKSYFKKIIDIFPTITSSLHYNTMENTPKWALYHLNGLLVGLVCCGAYGCIEGARLAKRLSAKGKLN